MPVVQQSHVTPWYHKCGIVNGKRGNVLSPNSGNWRFFYSVAAAVVVTALLGVVVGFIGISWWSRQPGPGGQVIHNAASDARRDEVVPPDGVPRIRDVDQDGSGNGSDESGRLDSLPTGVDLQPVLYGLEQPVYLTHAGDGTNRLFIVEQTGRVLVWLPDSDEPQLYLDLSDQITSGGERGLLSVAFHPSFKANGLFYVSYTDRRGDSVLASYQVRDPAHGLPDPASRKILLTVSQPQTNHNGGLIKFGPDGYLYFGLGDGGSSPEAQSNGQNPEALLGSMLRLNVDAPGGNLIPFDNPFVGQPGRDEIWAIGLRNPWRFSFDWETGDLYIADVGANAREEINFQPADSAGGENYGWPIWEGSVRRTQQEPISQVTLPVAEYETGRDGCAVTGGYVYRGQAIPSLKGIYLYSDYCSGILWGLVRRGDRWRTDQIMPTGLRVSSFGEDEAGELYLLDHGDGGIFKLVPGSNPIPPLLIDY